MVAQYWPFVLIAWGVLRLIEGLIWHREGVRGSFTGGEVVLIMLICIAGSGIWQAREHGVRFMRGGLDFWGEQYDFPVSATGSAAGMKRIVFENPRGNIKVTGGDSKEVTVTGRKLIHAYRREDADRTNTATPLEIIPQGDRLLVRTNQDRVPEQSAHLRRPRSHGAARHGGGIARRRGRPRSERYRGRCRDRQQPRRRAAVPGGRQCAPGREPQRPDSRHGREGHGSTCRAAAPMWNWRISPGRSPSAAASAAR